VVTLKKGDLSFPGFPKVRNWIRHLLILWVPQGLGGLIPNLRIWGGKFHFGTQKEIWPYFYFPFPFGIKVDNKKKEGPQKKEVLLGNLFFKDLNFIDKFLNFNGLSIFSQI